jgi:hypothetical protein
VGCASRALRPFSTKKIIIIFNIKIKNIKKLKYKKINKKIQKENLF